MVITDQIAAKGKEDQEENEMGRVLPMTLGGLEYFVDVMVEMSLRLDGFEPVRVARVIKTNSPYFPMGLELTNPTFSDFLTRMKDTPQVVPDDIPEFLLPQASAPANPGPTLQDLVIQAEGFGVERAQLLTAARHYHKADSLEGLTKEQIADLLERLTERYAPSGEETESSRRPKKEKMT